MLKIGCACLLRIFDQKCNRTTSSLHRWAAFSLKQQVHSVRVVLMLTCHSHSNRWPQWQEVHFGSFGQLASYLAFSGDSGPSVSNSSCCGPPEVELATPVRPSNIWRATDQWSPLPWLPSDSAVLLQCRDAKNSSIRFSECKNGSAKLLSGFQQLEYASKLIFFPSLICALKP